jgi:hypothetical protein
MGKAQDNYGAEAVQMKSMTEKEVKCSTRGIYLYGIHYRFECPINRVPQKVIVP